jgi:hypothetical protein
MKGKLNEMKATRVWLDWLPLWVAWIISTTLGWFLTWLLTIVMAFAFVIPDPDAARIYLSSSPWERLSDGLLLGAMVGVIPGLVMGLFQIVLRRSTRDVILAVLATIVGSALLCVVGRAGGPQIESAFMTTLRLGILGGAIGGGFVGLCQWIILRRKVSKVNGWILLTVASWVIGWTITLWATGLMEQFSSALPVGPVPGPIEQRALNPTLSFAALFAGGAIIGLGQWLLLRHNVKRAGWWILATVISWSIAGGAGIGLITGTTLVLLLRFAPRSPQQRAA